MSDRARDVRVGAWVLGGFALACALLLGAGSLLELRPRIETVFDESVQGLEVGSSVYLRGIKIGEVSEIGFVGAAYDVSGSPDPIAAAGRVLVRMEIARAAQSFSGPPELAELVRRGLRLQLAPVGITGSTVIQADFLDPEQYPPREPSWKPDTLYVPSAPSTLTRLSSAADRLITRLGQLDAERRGDTAEGHR